MFVISAAPDTAGQISQAPDFPLPPQGADQSDMAGLLASQMQKAAALRQGSAQANSQHYGLLGGLLGGADRAAQNHGLIGRLGGSLVGSAASGLAGSMGGGAAAGGAAAGGGGLASFLPFLF